MQPLHSNAQDNSFDETAFAREPLGPSSRSCCKVSNRNSCGSGSHVGIRDGKSLILTNAHVAGSRLGHTVVCEFPFLGRKRFNARVVMAAYSDRIMMDWAVLEIDQVVDLPVVKLANKRPSGEHYTGGYPRCQGPYFQKLTTRQITHSGTVWRWQPNSIGGQSGSGVHSLQDNLQYGLLTWSWGGDGAGQTASSIWFQYANRAAVGFERPEGLIELADNRAEGLENGFFQETNITTLPIWDHLDDGTEPDPDPPEGCKAFAAQVLKEAAELQTRAGKLAELARRYQSSASDDSTDSGDGEDDNGTIFGL